MTKPDFGALAGINTLDPKKAWEPPTLETFGSGNVLAFDQSLTATGWVHVASYSGVVGIVASGTESPKIEGFRGYEQDLRRGVYLFTRLHKVLAGHLGPETLLAHEHPPMGKVKGGGTSSLMSALSLRIVCWEFGREVVMLGAQPAKKLICGNANADKKTAHAALALHLAQHIEGYAEHITNEAKRDALMVALLRLHKEKR